MKWIHTEGVKRPIKSWCEHVEPEALQQAINLANHPVIYKHVALMPDCHVGYGMPIGGVIACDSAVIPNAVGVDIGCGMGVIETNFHASEIKGKEQIRSLFNYIKTRTPVGEGHAHKNSQKWDGFDQFLDSINDSMPGWHNDKSWNLDSRNLGSLGGGNHFIELQKSDSDMIWLMLHSGSRNLGHRIASYYHKMAIDINQKQNINLPDKHLSFLPMDEEGKNYLRDMNFALKYAAENRRKIMEVFKEAIIEIIGDIKFLQEINIHHNYACQEFHFNKDVIIHRKGATSARKGQKGIIPGSMGTASYIVDGLGNTDSFMSCSHGAGRALGRKEACRILSVKECDKSMEGIVFDRWRKYKGWGKGKKEKILDLSEAPFAYKDIEEVIKAEMDLIKPIVRLTPLGVVKG